MAATVKLSFTVLSGTWISASTQDADFPVTNLASPWRPFQPWKTTAGGAQNAVYDLGAATTVEIIALLRCNFTSVVIQGNATDSWGAPSYTSGTITLTQNPWNWRYNLALLPVGFTYRFLRISIPSQTPVAEFKRTALSIYLIGGVWIGAVTASVDNPLWDVEYETFNPLDRQEPRHRGWAQEASMGEPKLMIIGRRAGTMSTTTPAVGDELATWQSIERQAWAQGNRMLWYENLGNTSQVCVVRNLQMPHWVLHGTQAEGPWELEEVVGGPSGT